MTEVQRQTTRNMMEKAEAHTHTHTLHRSHTECVRQIYTQEVPPTPLPLVTYSLSLSRSLNVSDGSVLLSSSQSCFSPH